MLLLRARLRARLPARIGGGIVDFSKLARKAKQIYTKRGGAQAAKGDAREVGGILKSEGTITDKAKRAAEALKEPGAVKDPGAARDPTVPTQTEPPATQEKRTHG
jgi:hypothetical protein